MGIHFEYFRRANSDLYIAHPLEQLSEEDLARLTKEAGKLIGELREHLLVGYSLANDLTNISKMGGICREKG